MISSLFHFLSRHFGWLVGQFNLTHHMRNVDVTFFRAFCDWFHHVLLWLCHSLLSCLRLCSPSAISQHCHFCSCMRRNKKSRHVFVYLTAFVVSCILYTFHVNWTEIYWPNNTTQFSNEYSKWRRKNWLPAIIS